MSTENHTNVDPEPIVEDKLPVTAIRPEIKKFSISETIDLMKGMNSRMTRERHQPQTLGFYLSSISDTELAKAYVDFYGHYPYFSKVCAGAKHHHWWQGGLEDHVLEMIGIGLDLIQLYPGDCDRFTRDDVIITCFLHDFAKVWQYRLITSEDRIKNKRLHPKQVFTYTEGSFDILNHETKTLLELGRHGIVPTDKQWSAVAFCEGGFAQANFDFGGASNQSRTVYTHNPLASFISILDLYSSQILGRSIA